MHFEFALWLRRERGLASAVGAHSPKSLLGQGG